MQDSKLVVIAAQDGQGKSLILSHLLARRVNKGVVVALAPGLRIPSGRAIELMRPHPPASAGGARMIAVVALNLPPESWLIVDDAETFLSPTLGRRNPFRGFITYRRNLGVNVALVCKDPLEFPRPLRTNARLWIVHPGGDADILRWYKRVGFPEGGLEDHEFWVGRPPGPFEKIHAFALDSWDPPV